MIEAIAAGVGCGYARRGVRLTLVLTRCFGGAAGNRIDILERHELVDFSDLGWWPVFNLADVAIVAGLAAALWR